MTGDRLRWGILGTGGIAARFAADLALSGVGRVVAVGSRTDGAAERFANRFDVAARHGSYEALVDDGDVDAVYVATPHPFHHANAMLALEAGKAVLVEKPFTMNADEARDLVVTARARGLYLMEAMWTRFLPHVAKLRELLAEGALGEIVSVAADHGQWFADDPAFRLFAPGLGGGALLDLGIYPVSFSSMVLGTPDRVVCISDAAFTGVDAQTSILLGHASGAHAVLTCTLRAKSATRASIVGTNARIDVEGDFYAPTSFRVVARSGESTTYDDHRPAGRGLHCQAEEVARCLAAGRTESLLMPLDESVSIMETMDEVRAVALGAP